jgi:hypothetical protein
VSPAIRLPFALALAASLVAGACGSSSNSSDPSAVAAATPDPAAGGVLDESGQPRFGSEEFGLTTEELATRIEQTEAAIGGCMTAAGFEYVAVDFATVYEAMGSDGSAPGVSDEDYLAQFGFGITTQFDDPVVANGKGEQNVAIFDSLAEGDQVAYLRELYGDDETATLARALEDEDFADTGGCTRSAAEQFFSPDELSGSYVNPGDVVIDQEPRMIAAIEEWSTCMRDEGYDYANPDALDDDLAEQLDAIIDGVDPQTLGGSALDALTELQGFELAVAPVATECEEEHIDPVQEQIETEIYGAPQP